MANKNKTSRAAFLFAVISIIVIIASFVFVSASENNKNPSLLENSSKKVLSRPQHNLRIIASTYRLASDASSFGLTQCQAINAPGTYVLTQDVASAGTCFTVNANNVILDGNGRTLTYSQNVFGFGFNLSGISNVTIKNFNIVKGAYTEHGNVAFLMSSINSSSIINNNISIGVKINDAIFCKKDCSSNNISNNRITSNSHSVSGFVCQGPCDNNSITSNFISLGGLTGNNQGISIGDGSNNLISSNVLSVSGANPIGIYLSSSIQQSFNVISNNNITVIDPKNFGQGIRLDGANSNIAGNNIKSDGMGIITESEGSTYINNVITSSKTGIMISGNDLDIKSNTINVTTRGQNAVQLYSPSNNFGDLSYVNIVNNNIFVIGVASNALNIYPSNYDLDINHIVIAPNNVIGDSISPVSSSQNVSSCQAITSPGNYILTQSIASAGTCFTVNASDVTLDGNGYTLTYSQSAFGMGFNVSKVNNTVIKNFNIAKGSYSSAGGNTAIAMRFTNNNSIINNNFTIGARINNVIFCYQDCSSNNITNNNMISTSDSSAGFLCWSNCNNNNIVGNKMSMNAITGNNQGISIGDNSKNNLIGYNVVSVSGWNPIGITTTNEEGAQFNSILNNNITVIDPKNFGQGIRSYGADSVVSDNIIKSDGNGMIITASNSKYLNNLVTSSRTGFLLTGRRLNISYNNINITISGQKAVSMYNQQFSFYGNLTNVESINNNISVVGGISNAFLIDPPGYNLIQNNITISPNNIQSI